MNKKNRDKREFSDRRKNKSKNHKNSKREVKRRGEDRKNNVVYYSAVFISFATLAIFFTVSILYR
ncbi:MAG: hypothetical protein GY793_00240 [Proteobacteria bacterium]|nr:hypothetical protein [Pseudomonadota bacterium]